MRLIDADDLIARIDKAVQIMDIDSIPVPYIRQCVIEMPAISPETIVKHGRWEYDHGAWQCSQCAEDNPYGIDFEARKFSNYCPNCGAKMDLEENELC